MNNGSHLQNSESLPNSPSYPDSQQIAKMKVSGILKTCTLFFLLCAPRLVQAQASTSQTPVVKPGNQALLQQNLVSSPTAQPLSAPLRTDASKTTEIKKQALTRQLERRRFELQVRHEERATPVRAAPAKKN